MAATADDKPVISFRDKAEWATWLASNAASSGGIWLRMAKKGSGIASVNYAEAVDVALCYGWIDGQGKSEDDRWWRQKFTPRGKRSIWSKRNREKVAALIDSGEMRAQGLAAVERAKSDGRWEAAYDPPSRMTVPEDLEAALKRNARARKFFAELDAQNRYAILFRINTAKKPETRANRIEKFVEMLGRGEKIHS